MGEKTCKKIQRKSTKSKGLRRSSIKTSGFNGPFICQKKHHAHVKPGWTQHDHEEYQASLNAKYRRIRDSLHLAPGTGVV